MSFERVNSKGKIVQYDKSCQGHLLYCGPKVDSMGNLGNHWVYSVNPTRSTEGKAFLNTV